MVGASGCMFDIGVGEKEKTGPKIQPLDPSSMPGLLIVGYVWARKGTIPREVGGTPGTLDLESKM